MFVQVFNPSGFSCHVEANSAFGRATESELVEAEHYLENKENCTRTAIGRMTDSDYLSKERKLCEIPYSRKYWRYLNLAVWPLIAIVEILVDFNLADQ